MEKLVLTLACVFCEIVNETAPASFVYADEQAVAFMDTQPVLEGHLLVVPRIHAASLAEMNLSTGCHLFRLAVDLSKAMRQSGIRCEGASLFLADGEAAGQEIMHRICIWFPGFGEMASEYISARDTTTCRRGPRWVKQLRESGRLWRVDRR